MFTAAATSTAVDRFLTHGLEASERAIVERLYDLGERGLTVLEVGGGVGDLHVGLLDRGVATSAINVELTPTWEAAASRLLADRHLTDRVTRHLGDFVGLAPSLPHVDAVVLHRVVCCYPDWKGLLDTAAGRARRLVVLTFPKGWTRPLMAVENLWHRVRGREFRAFVHSPEAMISELGARGLGAIADFGTPLWRTVMVSRG